MHARIAPVFLSTEEEILASERIWPNHRVFLDRVEQLYRENHRLIVFLGEEIRERFFLLLYLSLILGEKE